MIGQGVDPDAEIDCALIKKGWLRIQFPLPFLVFSYKVHLDLEDYERHKQPSSM